MSFLKQLLNPFIEFDENKKTGLPGDITPVAQPLKEEAPTTHPLITDSKPDAGLANDPQTLPADNHSTLPYPEHVAYFEKLIDKANNENPLFAGPDYKEFQDSKIDIDDIADESLKYTTAFNILKSSGLDKKKLMTTAQEYSNLIGRDLNAFQTAHAQLYKKELQQKETDLKDKAEELSELLRRISLLKSDINQLTGEIATSGQKLNKIKSSFLLAGENKQREIQIELEKISRYFG